jgi:Domain of unknown function (DUF4326)
MPTRIQRKRTKGWKMPENTIYVGRPSKWGNPFLIGIDPLMHKHPAPWYARTAKEAIFFYRRWLNCFPDFPKIVRKSLRGKNLACWCPLDQPCHADVLLEIANLEEK